LSESVKKKRFFSGRQIIVISATISEHISATSK